VIFNNTGEDVIDNLKIEGFEGRQIEVNLIRINHIEIRNVHLTLSQTVFKFTNNSWSGGILGTINNLKVEWGPYDDCSCFVFGCHFVETIEIVGIFRFVVEDCSFANGISINFTCPLWLRNPGIEFVSIEGEFTPKRIDYWFSALESSGCYYYYYNDYAYDSASFLDHSDSIDMSKLVQKIFLHNEKQRVEYSLELTRNVLQAIAVLGEDGVNSIDIVGKYPERVDIFIGGMVCVGLAALGFMCGCVNCCQSCYTQSTIREREKEMAEEAMRRSASAQQW
jgi:hypothetical protein